jgi:hypothetical protein
VRQGTPPANPRRDWRAEMSVVAREVEFLGEGSIEVERFLSDGEICGEEAFERLTRYAAPEHAEIR